jgi:prepilin-type processing-associated H-X9-DG protein
VLGTTLVNRLDDAPKVEASLNQFAAGFNNAVRNQIRDEDVTVEIRQQKLADGTMMHYLAVPIITPSWAVKNGNLYVALYPQVIASAVAQGPETKSILTNEKFNALRKRLEAPGVTSIQFADLQATVPNGYGTWLLLSRYIGFGDIFGIKTPAMIIPPMNVLRQHLGPAGAVTWTDAAGWHMRGTSPFPGSESLATDPLTSMGAGQSALMISILLPSLNRARETANRVKCASNQRQMSMAMLLYSNENRGKFPPKFGDLLRTQDITVDVFLCPSAGTQVPPEIRAGGVEAMAKWVDEGNSDYVYAGAGKDNREPADNVVIYEKMHNHDHDGINMAFGDGHVEFQMRQGAEQQLQRQGLEVAE